MGYRIEVRILVYETGNHNLLINYGSRKERVICVDGMLTAQDVTVGAFSLGAAATDALHSIAREMEATPAQDEDGEDE